MRSECFITMDAHCRTTDVCVKTAKGKLVKREHLSTGIPQIRELIESVPRPRRVAFEEGAMAGWLFRHLKGSADEVIVCDPRRNALVPRTATRTIRSTPRSDSGLYRSGHLRQVHQLDESQKAAAKQVIGMHHDRVAHRVAEANQLLALLPQQGGAQIPPRLRSSTRVLLSFPGVSLAPAGYQCPCGRGRAGRGCPTSHT
ncbi:MAG TPA: hypothetical protein VN541_06885 [Tepidisphaeraceae bacterium]|nr:hypothetical protein [Tepidisphaeraceae bacterium]